MNYSVIVKVFLIHREKSLISEGIQQNEVHLMCDKLIQFGLIVKKGQAQLLCILKKIIFTWCETSVGLYKKIAK